MEANTPPAAADDIDQIAARAPKGMIIPPKSLRPVLEKTATLALLRGRAFEERVQQNASKAKAGFLDPGDAYNPFYKWRKEEIQAGRGVKPADGTSTQPGSVQEGGVGSDWKGKTKSQPPKPDDLLFDARMPNISAKDLRVVKATAVFTAKHGRPWMSQLAQKQAGNFQFDFLRPQHTMYQYFSRLVDHFSDLSTGGIKEGGRPLQQKKDRVYLGLEKPNHVFDAAKKRAEWVQFQESQKVQKAEKEEKERIEYQQIDWHDFAVVETVRFDERDEEVNLAPPLSLNDLQSASLEQKAAMRISADRRIEDVIPDFDDFNVSDNTQPQLNPGQQPFHIPQQANTAVPAWQMPTVASDDVAARIPTAAQERDRARAAQEAARVAPTNMNIRNDWQPRALSRRVINNTSICPRCKLPIPNDEMEEHMRVEMLDPNWKENARKAQERSITTNLSVQDVAGNLKRLASQRTDLFNPVTGHAVTEEERERRKRVELGSYDGVSPLANQTATAYTGMTTVAPGVGPPPGTDPNHPADVQEQIRLLHQRYGA